MARELRVTIVGDSTALQAALARASGATAGFGASMEKAGARIGSAGKTLTKGVTLPLVAIGALSTKAAVDFQNAMELLHTQAGVAQSAIAGLSKSVLALAGPTATAPDELAAGLYHLESQGLRGAKAIDTLRIAAEGAKMGQANLEDVTNALGAVISSNIGGVHSYGQAMGELNATVGAGDMRMQDLADAMGTGLPAKAAVAGVSLRDVAAALATFGDNNIRGAQAGTLLNSTLRLMEGPSKAAAKAMSEIGLSASDLGNTLRNKGLVAALELLKGKLEGLPKAEQFAALTHIFGGRQAGGVMLLIDQLDRLKTKEKEVAAGGASFAKDWSAYTQTAAYHLSSMGANMQAAGVSIGTILLPVVSELTNKIAAAVQWFDGLSNGVKKFILVAAGVAAVIGPVLSVVGSIVSFVGVLAGLGATAAIILGVVAAVAALAAVFAAAVIWPQKFQAVLEALGLSAQHAAAVTHVLQAAFQDIQAVVSTVISVVESLWSTFGAVLLAQARTEWNLIKAEIQGALNIIRGVIDVVTGLIHGDWSQVWHGIEEIVRGVWTVIKALVKAALETLRNIVVAGFHAVVAVIRGQVGAATSAAEALAHGVLNGIRNVLNGLAGVVRGLISRAVAAVRGFVGAAISAGAAVGSAIIHGIISGVEGAVGGAIAAVKHAVGSVVGAAKGFLHIHSPSRLMATEVGKPMMEGVVAGWELVDLPGEMKKHLKRATDTVSGWVQEKGKKTMSDQGWILAGSFHQGFDNTGKFGSTWLNKLATAKKGVDNWAGTTASTNMQGVGKLLGSKVADGIGSTQAKIQEVAKAAIDVTTPMLGKLGAAIGNIGGQSKNASQQIANVSDSLAKLNGSHAVARIDTYVLTHTASESDSLSNVLAHVGGGGSLGLGAIRAFASGVRNFGGGLALVGEEGPEIVRLPRGSDVINNAQSRRLLSGDKRAGTDAPLFGEVHVHNEVDVELVARRVQRLLAFEGR